MDTRLINHANQPPQKNSEQVVAYALSRRPNVKLVETGLPFGREGFTGFQGKHFDPSLRLTRRYYPHSYNVDGFFVAKFQKTGPTPPNAVLANRSKGGATSTITAATATATAAGRSGKREDGDEDEVIDKTPIGADEEDRDEDDFGGFDDEEDSKYMDRAKRNAMRRRGLDPKALNRKTSEEGTVQAKKTDKGEKKTAKKGRPS